VPRPKLLFLSHRLPFPPHNGAAIRTFNILKQLARDFDITALCFDREDSATRGTPLADRIAALEREARSEVFAIPQQASRARLVWDHLRSVAGRKAYTHYVHQAADYEARLLHHLAEGQWSLVHLESTDLLRFLPLLKKLPVVCTHHNVESSLLRRRAQAERSAPVRGYMRLQASLLENDERRTIGALALNVAVSEDDAAAFRRMAPGARVIVVPNGVDTEAFRPATLPQEGCVFVGGTSWFPNKDGLEWFVQSILPELERRSWNSEVVWVGRATEEEMAKYRGIRGLRLTGYVEDIQPYVHRATCFLVPLRVGGGTRLKILDAWAMGKAVVSTSIGCEGLKTRQDENIVIADTPELFAGQVIQLLHDPERVRRLGDAARRTAVDHYSWNSLGDRMLEEYHRLLRPSRQVVGEGSAG